MKKYLPLLLLALFACISCDKENPEDLFKKGIAIITADPTDVTENSVTLHGYVNPEYLLSGGKIGFEVYQIVDGEKQNGFSSGVTNVDSDNHFQLELNHLSLESEYAFTACLDKGDVKLEGDVKKFATRKLPVTVVDLGLSVMWAECDLGASSPEIRGNYYAWGDTEPLSPSAKSYPPYKWETSDGKYTKYCDNENRWAGEGKPDGKTRLDPEDDVATVKYGGKWRMPTQMEMLELVNSCKKSLSVLNDQQVLVFTSNKNGKSICFPVGSSSKTKVITTVFFWTSELYNYYTAYTLLYYLEENRLVTNNTARDDYNRVRPVLDLN